MDQVNSSIPPIYLFFLIHPCRLSSDANKTGVMTPEEAAIISKAARLYLREIAATLATVKPELLLLFKTKYFLSS